MSTCKHKDCSPIEYWQVGSTEPKPDWVEMVDIPDISRPLVKCGAMHWKEVEDGYFIIKETDSDIDICTPSIFGIIYEIID